MNSQEEEEKKSETVKIKKLGDSHICSDGKASDNKIMEIQSDNIVLNEEKEDDEQLKTYIKNNPLKGAFSIRDWCKTKKNKSNLL